MDSLDQEQISVQSGLSHRMTALIEVSQFGNCNLQKLQSRGQLFYKYLNLAQEI